MADLRAIRITRGVVVGVRPPRYPQPGDVLLVPEECTDAIAVQIVAAGKAVWCERPAPKAAPPPPPPNREINTSDTSGGVAPQPKKRMFKRKKGDN